MPNPTCLNENCEKESITYSAFCGQHTNNRTFNSVLRNLKETELTNIFWDEVDIKKLRFSEKDFISSLITNSDFSNVKFRNCQFNTPVFEHVVFTECIFENCKFEQMDFTDVTLHETIFADCQFEDCRFNEINFADESKLLNCNLDSCNFSGGIFSETGVNSNTKFIYNTFTQVSISQSGFQNCQFIETEFSKTSFYDSTFYYCLFNTITHDFKLTGVPILCDFLGSEFTNTSISPSFRKWNNLKESRQVFYMKLVDWILSVNHPNFLRELALALKRLEELKLPGNIQLNERVHQLFKRVASEAAHAGNYEIIGEILSAYGRIPERYRAKQGFFLPPPDGEMRENQNMARLKITAEMELWTLSRVSRLINLLEQLEPLLPEGSPQVIRYIEQGSFIIEILGSFKQLLAGFQSLLDFKKTNWEVRIKELEFRKLQIDLDHYEKTKKIDLKKSELELYNQQLELFRKLKEQTGFDFIAYSRTQEGQNAKELAEIIKNEFPILNLRLED